MQFLHLLFYFTFAWSLTMSDNVGPPTIEALLTELKDVTEWKVFGVHLSFPYADLEKIQLHTMLKSVDDYKLHMFGKWLERGTNTTWGYIAKALIDSGYTVLAKAISHKYSSVIDELACPVNSFQPQLQNNTKAETEPDVMVEKSVVETLKEFESEFALLVVNTQEKCNDINVSKLLIYVKNCLPTAFKSRVPLPNSPNACENLFHVLSSYWDCLRISPLDDIITNFLKEDIALNSDLTKYNANFDSFKKSTKLRDLVDVIKRKQKISTKPVILKLGRMWKDVTLENFKCLIEILFYELNEQLYGLQVTAGSVCAEWLIPDDETVTNLIIAVSSLSSNTLRLCGVLYLQIGNQIIWKDKDCTILSANDGLVEALQLQDVCAVELFLSIGADPYIELPSGQLAVTAAIQLRDPLDSTVLHTACQHGHLETAELLIEVSILLEEEALNRADALGYTPLSIATTNGHHSLAGLLSNNGAVSMTSTQSINTNILKRLLGVSDTQLLSLSSYSKKYIGIIRVLFHLLIESIEIKSSYKIPEPEGIAELLKESRTIVDAFYSDDQRTALHIACDNGRLKLVSLLLSIGANINAVTGSGTTPLMVACKSTDHVIVQRLLQEPTIDIDAVDSNGWSALHFAVFATSIVLNALVTKGGNPNVRDTSGWVPLDYAITFDKIDAISALLKSPYQLDCVQKLPTHEIPIHLACEKSTAEVIDVLIQYGADINKKHNGMTPLMVACKRGHYGIVQHLLQKPSIDIDAVGYKGKHALHFAVFTSSKIVTALVTKGANPNIMDESGWTPLYHAIRHSNIDVVLALLQSVRKLIVPLWLACEKSTTEVVDVLIQYGADVNSKYNGITPLMVACRRKHYEIVQRLLQEPKIDIDAVDLNGKSALHFAILTSNIVTALVTKGANPNIRDTAGWAPLDYAIRFDKIDTISALVQSSYQLDCVQKIPTHEIPIIPIHLACEKSNTKVVDVLIQYGADVNRKYNGLTPLMVACKRGHNGIIQRLLQEPNIDIDAVDSISGKCALHFAILTSEIVTALVTKGANPNIRDESGWTPVDYAIGHNNIDAISALLQSSYQLDCVQKLLAHEIPIHFACEQSTAEVVDVFIRYGADVNRKHNGMTPLMVACKRGHYGIVQRLLKSQKLIVNAQDSNRLTALHFSVQSNSVEIVCTLLLKGADPNIAITSTPLITACASSNLQIVKELLKAKADVNGQDEDGTTALYMSSSNGNFGIVNKLLSSGANPNIFVQGTKWTPLIVASANGHIDVVKSLLKAKADIHYQDVYGKTALHAAVQCNHVDIVNELIQANVNPTLTTTDGETALAIAMKQNPPNEDMVKMLREAMNAYYNKTEGHRLLTMLRTSTSTDQYSLITADTQSLESLGVVSHQKSLVSEATVDSGISTGSKGTDTQSLASATSHDSGYHQQIPKLASTHHDIPKHKDLPSLSPHEEEHTTSSTHEQDNS